MISSAEAAAVPRVVADPIRVLVVDDHALFRRGLEMVLAHEADIDIVGEASDGTEAVDRAAALLPDIVLMDVQMPKRSGIDACTAIKDVVPSAKIVMLTVSEDEADLYEAIKAGASGYLLKEISIEEVATGLRAVAGGQSLISPSMAAKLLTEFSTMMKRGDDRQQVPAPRLTERELDVLRLVAQGLTNAEVADRLILSPLTINAHLRSIYGKLEVTSRATATRFAVDHHLV